MSKSIKRRAWLNSRNHHSTAFLYITGYVYKDYSTKTAAINCHIKIADCSREITLDCDADDDNEFANTVQKLDKLIEGLEAARSFIIDNYESQGKRCD